MRNEQLLSVERSLLLVIDLQEAFTPHIFELDRIIERTRILVEAAQLLGVPILVTEQYPKGLGQTVEPIRTRLAAAPRFEKSEFSVFQNEAIAQAIRETQRTQILLAGVEAHVCVAQTAFDALAAGLQPYLVADAVGSRRTFDMKIVLARLRHAGATVTTAEAAILELTATARHPQFKAISKLIK